jgi:uncharacterized repeat protein (TIGR03943 family)
VNNYDEFYTPEQIMSRLKLGNDSSTYSFSEWLAIRRVDENFAFQNNKYVKVTGLVLKPEEVPDDIFFVTRSMISCCAVDSIPYGFPVKFDTWQNTIEQDDWVEVVGIYKVMTRKGEDKLIIEADSIKKIEEPKDPYIYF